MTGAVEILAAEDSPTQAERLRYVLTAAGYRVTLAANGAEALQAFRERRPDLVITDVVMPKLDGYSLCRSLKSEPTTRGVPVILLTSLSEPQEVIKGLECGADSFIRKPYDEQHLVARIADFLLERRLRASHALGGGSGVVIGGRKQHIGSERQQILDFLFSSYEEIALANEALRKQQLELEDKRAELEAKQEQLAHALSVNQAVLDASLDAICLADPHGEVLVANAVCQRLTSELLPDADAMTIDERIAGYARLTDDPERVRAELAFADDPSRQVVTELDLVAHRRTLKCYSAPVPDSEGHLIGRIFVLRDVTAEREADRLKSELVATVSHELRTPLSGVLGFVELLLTRDHEPETSRRYLQTIRAEARRLSELVDEFLDLQRIESGRFELRLEPFDLGELVSESTELFSRQSPDHTLRLACTDAELFVEGARDRIGQVLGNLLSNAIKYSPEGGDVEIATTVSNGVARVSVRDSGIGIPVEEQQEVFKKFFRASTAHETGIGGTGLGLALSHEIIERHGGRLGFESAEGVGSTFWFELWLARAPATTA